MGRREPDYQTTICCVVSLSQLLKEASIAVNTLSLSHSNKEVSHPQAEAKKKKKKKALEDTTPPATEGLVRSSRATLLPGTLSPGNERVRPLLPRPPFTPTELRPSAWHLTTNPKPAFAPATGTEADNGTWRSDS